MGNYHLSKIPHGELGQFSKITEEYFECLDSLEQESKIMLLVELSDLIGAIELYLEKNFSGFSLQDLIIMSNITKRARKND